VKDRYNRASNGARALHAIWLRHTNDRSRSLADALAAPGAVEQLTAWLEPTADGAFSSADLDRRLRHFVRESSRAPRAAIAFRDADRATLGELSVESQREADELLGNQIPETVLMAKLARNLGAFASSNFGAGFGGSVWALVPTGDAVAFGEEWVRAYARQLPDMGQVPWFVARPGPAATDLPGLHP
jgi:galactokinase